LEHVRRSLAIAEESKYNHHSELTTKPASIFLEMPPGNNDIMKPSFLFPSPSQYRLPFIVLMHACFAAGALLMSFLFRFRLYIGFSQYPQYFYASLPIDVLVFLVFSGIFNLYRESGDTSALTISPI